MTDSLLLLASASPRRRQLLQQIGVDFSCLATDIDETPLPDEAARDYVRRMASEKAAAAVERAPTGSWKLVLAADTVVVVDGALLGKPADAAEAAAMLARLSDRSHRVMTAVTLCDGSRQRQLLSESDVCFRAIAQAEARRYWASGEPRGKAGGYAIQGLGAVFVKSLSGSYSGVMGLPLFETATLLESFGVSPLETTNEAGQ